MDSGVLGGVQIPIREGASVGRKKRSGSRYTQSDSAEGSTGTVRLSIGGVLDEVHPGCELANTLHYIRFLRWPKKQLQGPSRREKLPDHVRI